MTARQAPCPHTGLGTTALLLSSSLLHSTPHSTLPLPHSSPHSATPTPTPLSLEGWQATHCRRDTALPNSLTASLGHRRTWDPPSLPQALLAFVFLHIPTYPKSASSVNSSNCHDEAQGPWQSPSPPITAQRADHITASPGHRHMWGTLSTVPLTLLLLLAPLHPHSYHSRAGRRPSHWSHSPPELDHGFSWVSTR